MPQFGATRARTQGPAEKGGGAKYQEQRRGILAICMLCYDDYIRIQAMYRGDQTRAMGLMLWEYGAL